MPQISIYLDETENQIVEYYSKEWKLSKAETIKKLIRIKKSGEENGLAITC